MCPSVSTPGATLRTRLTLLTRILDPPSPSPAAHTHTHTKKELFSSIQNISWLQACCCVAELLPEVIEENCDDGGGEDGPLKPEYDDTEKSSKVAFLATLSHSITYGLINAIVAAPALISFSAIIFSVSLWNLWEASKTFTFHLFRLIGGVFCDTPNPPFSCPLERRNSMHLLSPWWMQRSIAEGLEDVKKSKIQIDWGKKVEQMIDSVPSHVKRKNLVYPAQLALMWQEASF